MLDINRMTRLLLILLVAIMTGCSMAFGPGYSFDDKNYFMDRPYIVEERDGYSLCWRYGEMGFYFKPRHSVKDGKLLFALQGTSSSGVLKGKYGESQINEDAEIQALKHSGAFWLEPDGTLHALDVRVHGACRGQQSVTNDIGTESPCN